MNPDILDYSGFTCWLSLMMISAVVVNAWQATMNADESLNLVPSLSSLISYCLHFKVFTARTHESIYLGNVIQFYIEVKWTAMSFSASHGKVGKTNFLQLHMMLLKDPWPLEWTFLPYNNFSNLLIITEYACSLKYFIGTIFSLFLWHVSLMVDLILWTILSATDKIKARSSLNACLVSQKL